MEVINLPRGRKVNSSGEKSKKLLLEKAIELFSQRGYHETKISDIVKAANLTQPTFYLYFTNKESLYTDLLSQFSNSVIDIIHRDLNDHHDGNVIRKVENCISNLFKYFKENQNLTKMGFHSEVSEEIKNYFSQLLEEQFNLVKNQYGVHIDSKLIADSLIGSVERLAFTALLEEEKQPEELASTIIQIFFHEVYV